MNINPKAVKLVKDVKKLFALPEVCTRLHEMLEDPRYTINDLGKVIGQDVDLTARLLKIVNSSFYGYPSRIDTINRAISVIGNSELLVLVLATSAVRSFKDIPDDITNMSNFWRHSVYCAVVGRLLAKHCNVLHAERLFVAGLLHDIGHLVIYHKHPQEAKQILARYREGTEELYVLEQEILGFDHGDAGAAMAKNWGLPDSLVEAIGCHHQPEKAERHKLDASIVHIANIMTNIAESGTDLEVNRERIHNDAWQVTGISDQELDPLLDHATPLFGEALELILPRQLRS